MGTVGTTELPTVVAQNAHKKGTTRVPQDTQISLSQQNPLGPINASHLTLEAIYIALEIQLNTCIHVG